MKRKKSSAYARSNKFEKRRFCSTYYKSNHEEPLTEASLAIISNSYEELEIAISFPCNYFHHYSSNCIIKPRCLKCDYEHTLKDCPTRGKVKLQRSYSYFFLERMSKFFSSLNHQQRFC
ncbi:hypothetical protein CEXT_377561 [Caerostris extrusa]|uniref:Uncharacterized protein n=1 Tax=Caerostris extrusa TaxID=172846 RepID=A0AAV4WJ38_CAEEX|nr:hypothetical protein CEXT_377561 [Caerostris extrusa]